MVLRYHVPRYPRKGKLKPWCKGRRNLQYFVDSRGTVLGWPDAVPRPWRSPQHHLQRLLVISHQARHPAHYRAMTIRWNAMKRAIQNCLIASAVSSGYFKPRQLDPREATS